jgi:hypothetical protein
VLLALADACSRDDGTGCWPSAATLARKANISDRTVQRVIARLKTTQRHQWLTWAACIRAHGFGGWRVAIADDAVNVGTAVRACSGQLCGREAVSVTVAALLSLGAASATVAEAMSVPSTPPTRYTARHGPLISAHCAPAAPRSPIRPGTTEHAVCRAARGTPGRWIRRGGNSCAQMTVRDRLAISGQALVAAIGQIPRPSGGNRILTLVKRF